MVVNDQNAPFHLARCLVVIPDGGTDHVVHDFCKTRRIGDWSCDLKWTTQTLDSEPVYVTNDGLQNNLLCPTNVFKAMMTGV